MSSFFRTVVASAALLVVAAPAFAWQPLDSCRPVWSQQPSQYHVNQNGYSRIPLETVRSIFAAAFDEWSRPCCSDWEAVEMGLTSAVGEDNSARQNIFSFRETNWPSELGSPDSVLAVTLTTWAYDRRTGGCVDLTADMVFNAENHDFATSHSRSEIDLLSVTTHECGHWLGLTHSTVNEATMWASYIGESGRTLHADDEAGVCALYPGSCTCGSDGDCDDGEVCDGGTCVEPPCELDSDCASGLACDTGTGECVVPPCTSDADCLGYEVCEAGVCVADADCPTCLPCETEDDCGSAGWVCAGDGSGGGVCTKLCAAFGDCPGNSACYNVGEVNVCLNEDADVRGPCPSDYVCIDDSPVDPCDTITCGADEICEDGSCVPAGGDDGCVVCDPCDSSADCPGGDCYGFEAGGGTVCATPCSSDADCPPNTACWEFTSGGGGTTSLCLNADLETAGTCPSSFECVEEQDLCADVRCEGGATCDPATGLCVGGTDDVGPADAGMDAAPDAAGDTGSDATVIGDCPICTPCADDSQCTDGSVCELIGAAGRFCTRDCAGDASVCEGNSACFDVNIDGAPRSFCLNEDAASAGTCAASYACVITAESLPDAGGESDVVPVGPSPFLPTDSGCGCAATSPGHALPWLGVLALMGWRRRRA